MKKNRIIAVLASLLIGTNVASAGVLLDDNFTSGSTRVSRQNLPTSASWFQPGSTASNLVLDTSLHTMTQVSGGYATGYFTASNAPQSLNVGDSLTLSITFSLNNSANVSNGIRLGLFNSNSTSTNNYQVTADGSGFSSSLYNSYTGYGAFINPGSSAAGGMSITERNTTSSGASAQLFTNGEMSAVGTAVNAPNLTSGSSYTLTLVVTRTSSTSNTVTFTLNGVSVSYVDSTNPTTSFDAISIYNNLGSGNNITYSDISVTYQAIPEKKVSSLLFIGLGIGCVAYLMRSGKVQAMAFPSQN